jgi:hypothetical protein
MVVVTDPGGRMEAEQAHGDWEPTRVPVYAVIRFDPSRAGAEHQVMVWEVLADIEEAESEVEHLNAQVPKGRSTSYFIAPTCYYPEGRQVSISPWGRREATHAAETPVGPPAPPERVEGEWGFLIEAVDDEDDRSD